MGPREVEEDATRAPAIAKVQAIRKFITEEFRVKPKIDAREVALWVCSSEPDTSISKGFDRRHSGKWCLKNWSRAAPEGDLI